MVGAVVDPDPDVLHRVARRRRPSASPRRTPFSTAGMKPEGMTPPLIALTNSKPSIGRIVQRARSRCGSRRTARARRSASCGGRGPSPSGGSSPGTGTRGGFRLTSTPKRSLRRSTITSTCTCESPATICSPVCGSRWRSIVGSSSWSRRSAVNTLSSSPLLRGLHRERHHGRRQLDLRHLDRFVPRRPASRRRASPSAWRRRRCHRARTPRRGPSRRRRS